VTARECETGIETVVVIVTVLAAVVEMMVVGKRIVPDSE